MSKIILCDWCEKEIYRTASGSVDTETHTHRFPMVGEFHFCSKLCLLRYIRRCM